MSIQNQYLMSTRYSQSQKIIIIIVPNSSSNVITTTPTLILRKSYKKNSDFHGYNTRSKTSLRKPFVRLDKFTHSFLYNGIGIWNNLPEIIKMVNSFDPFKILTKKLVRSSQSIVV